MVDKKISLVKCRDCRYFEDQYDKDHKFTGCWCEKLEVKLKDGFDATADGCMWFRFSSDAWREYAE